MHVGKLRPREEKGLVQVTQNRHVTGWGMFHRPGCCTVFLAVQFILIEPTFLFSNFYMTGSKTFMDASLMWVKFYAYTRTPHCSWAEASMYTDLSDRSGQDGFSNSHY